MRPSTGVTVQEENLHCGFVTDRRLAVFNRPARVVSFKNLQTAALPNELGEGEAVWALWPVWTARKSYKVSCL